MAKWVIRATMLVDFGSKDITMAGNWIQEANPKDVHVSYFRADWGFMNDYTDKIEEAKGWPTEGQARAAAQKLGINASGASRIDFIDTMAIQEASEVIEVEAEEEGGLPPVTFSGFIPSRKDITGILILLLIAAACGGEKTHQGAESAPRLADIPAEAQRATATPQAPAGAYFPAFDNFDDTAYNHFTFYENGYMVHPGGAPVAGQYIRHMEIMYTRGMLIMRRAKQLLDSAAAADPNGKWYISGLAWNDGPGFDQYRTIKITKQP